MDEEGSHQLTTLSRLINRLQGGGRGDDEAAPRGLRKQSPDRDAEWASAEPSGLGSVESEAGMRDMPLPAALTAINFGIRTGLTNLLSFVAAQDGSNLSPADRALFQAAAHSGEAVLSWLDIMGLYTNLDQSDAEPELAPASLITQLSAAVSFAQLSAKERGADLVFTPDEGLSAPRMLDNEWLERCALNLFESVVKLHGDGRITISARADGADKVVITADGSGARQDQVAAELVRHVMAGDVWFATGDGGVTLRLAVARRSAQALGGELVARTTDSGGLAFDWRLPAPPAAHDAASAAVEAPMPSRARRILVVDDNTTNLRLVERMLRLVGHDVEVVRDGAAAVDAVEKANFDLILMDLHMPNMDGFAATSAIRGRDDAKGRTPIVAVTADVNTDVEQAAFDAGMDGFLAKPFEVDELLDVVARHSAGAEPGASH